MTTLLEEMELEDEIFRGALKRAAYEFESHGDPRVLQQYIDELSVGCKARMHALFVKHGLVSSRHEQLTDTLAVYPPPLRSEQAGDGWSEEDVTPQEAA